MSGMPGPSKYEHQLYNYSTGFINAPERDTYGSLESVALRGLARGNAEDKARALGRGNADFSAALADRGQSQDAVADAIRRGRGMSRMAQYTSDKADMQLLHDRLGALNRYRARQSTGMGALARAAGVDAAQAAADRSLNQFNHDVRQNTYGTLAGIGLNYGVNKFQGWWKNRSAAHNIDQTNVDVDVQPTSSMNQIDA